MEREPVRIPVAVAPDLGSRTRASDERVVVRYPTIIVQPDDLANVGPELLRERAQLAFSQCDEQVAILEREARSKVIVASHRRVRGEEPLAIDEPRIAEPSALDHRHLTGVGLLGIREVEPPGARVVGVDFDVEQTAVDRIGDRGHAGDSGHRAGANVEKPECARSIGDERSRVGKEGHPEWHPYAGRDNLDAITPELAVVLPTRTDGIGGTP